jgi:pyrroloquinoline quinone (PQQ) biosynthesis protein C
MKNEYGARRVYDTKRLADGSVALALDDRTVEIGAKEHAAYTRLVEWLHTRNGEADLALQTGMDVPTLTRFAAQLANTGLLYRMSELPDSVSGEEFHRDYFAKLLPSWLSEAFSHPFWERMTSGRGSARLFSGWMFELYHYTKNANRHMPLSCAFSRDKAIKGLRAKHYAEEWNHYHYFVKSLKALGFTEKDVTESVPLPMTLALSNFMRQAAREDILAYSICSAVLEGTTTDRKAFNPYYEKVVELYGVPRAAIEPIYAHLDLDVKYKHSDLFLDILQTVKTVPRARASRILDYGHQLVEHIWLWTHGIEAYYGADQASVPRRPFDVAVD